jgi:hypothetical protein
MKVGMFLLFLLIAALFNVRAVSNILQSSYVIVAVNILETVV